MFQTEKALTGSVTKAGENPSRRGVLRIFALGATAIAASVITARTARATIFTGYIEGTAVGGYDSVAYHTQGEAIPGSDAITLEYQGATWRFASEENKALFEANPTAYSPEYGGHCAWAMAQGYLAQGDPEVWRIVDGRLFLNATEGVNRRWLRNLDGFIVDADSNWPNFA
ncbi:MAG: YHS domain-containing (seleno)protein [Pseudomonadota bacterium]